MRTCQLKEEEGSQTYDGKMCVNKRDMTQAGLKEDKATNGRMEEEANQLYRRPEMTGQARDEEDWHTLYIM